MRSDMRPMVSRFVVGVHEARTTSTSFLLVQKPIRIHAVCRALGLLERRPVDVNPFDRDPKSEIVITSMRQIAAREIQSHLQPHIRLEILVSAMAKPTNQGITRLALKVWGDR